MKCPSCKNKARKFGKNRNGSQRFQCLECRTTFTPVDDRPLGAMRLDPAKAIMCLRMLLEGTSIRSTERLTGVNRNTIMSLVVTVGSRCKKFFEVAVQNVPVNDVQCDEIWGFVAMKEKTRIRRGLAEDGVGDVWCFTAMERHTKLILTYHVGKRTPDDTAHFAENLYHATQGRFQLTTDGFKPYRKAIPAILGDRVDFATLVKMYGHTEEDRGYSPGKVIGTSETPCCGNPDEDRICTSHIERSKKTLRMQIRRLTRLTDAHSKKWENHHAAMNLFFAFYNFCRVHSTIKKTPAMAAGLTNHAWSVGELLMKVAESTQS
jgi:transposase-like protein/IS1 family transposase